MKGMILAAGFGERLRPQTETLPKPLFTIGSTNMIRNAIGYLIANNVTDIAVNMHHLGHLVEKELSWGIRGKVNLELVKEETILGTAGGIKNAEDFLKDDYFCVVNSDILTDADLKAALSQHKETGALATLVVRDNPDPGRIGTLAVNEHGRLVRFLDHAAPDYDPARTDSKLKMFTGIAVYSPEFLEEIPPGRRVDISVEVFPPLMKKGAPIYTYNHDGYWADIGTPETYSRARMDVALSRFKTYRI